MTQWWICPNACKEALDGTAEMVIQSDIRPACAVCGYWMVITSGPASQVEPMVIPVPDEWKHGN